MVEKIRSGQHDMYDIYNQANITHKAQCVSNIRIETWDDDNQNNS